MTPRDSELLEKYVRQNSQDAFAELVNRHLNLVYSAALRQVRSPQLAEEVAQSAFADLARDARRLKPDTVLTAWLYQVTRRTAIDVVRRESRRQLREQIATEMNAINATASDWTHIEPLLDEAVSALEETDRAAILLRYFENKSLREVGQQLGVSDDAAQKRVSRAVERLREFFGKRGIAVGTSGLGVFISANAVHAAPAGLAITISAAASLTGATVTATATTIKTLAMTTFQKTIAVTVIAVAGVTAPLLIQHQAKAKLRDENQALRQQLDQRRADQERLSNTVLAVESAPVRTDPELLRLRSEVGQLRQRTNELVRLQAENQHLRSLSAVNAQPKAAAPEQAIPKESWSFAGYADPESAFQTLLWAASRGDAKSIMASLLPEGDDFKQLVDKPEAKLEEHQREMERVTAFKIIDKESISDSEVVLTVYASGINEAVRFKLQRVGSEWKFNGPVKDKGPPSTK